MNYLRQYTNKADGTEVQVYEMDSGKFGVRLFDLDAQETVGIVICPTIDAAIKKAESIAWMPPSGFSVAI